MKFTINDQEAFAELTGDWNPVHVDPVFARRTIAGKPVVHGIHLLLWALEVAARDGHSAEAVSALKAKFSGFVTIDDEVDVRVSQIGPSRLHLAVVSGGREKAEVTVTLDAPPPCGEASIQSERRFEPEREPLVCEPDEIEGMAGIVPPVASLEIWRERFPSATRWLGPARLAALGASTRLVGMVCPGLHSFYVGLNIQLCDDSMTDGSLSFRMDACRHGLVKAEIVGSGILGTLDCMVRAAPSAQRGTADLAGLVAPEAFTGDEVLVIGGSRGLGEVSAKLLALGGARVTITYAAGADDAARVAGEIKSAGHDCGVARYRLNDDIAELLGQLSSPPSHVYYFASPRIAANDSRFFDRARYSEMQAFFVDGFWDVVSAILEKRKDARFFYPSTVYLEARPKGLGEYAMAKAAGEALCAEINRALAPATVVVARLPQLATDQNLTSSRVLGSDPVESLLPILDSVQAKPAT